MGEFIMQAFGAMLLGGGMEGVDVDGMSHDDLLRMFGTGTEKKAADEGTVEMLDSQRLTFEDVGNLKEGHTECRICLTEYEEGDVVTTLPCGHNYHEQCNIQWMATNASCPVCKFDVKEWGKEQKKKTNNDKRNE